MGNIALGSRANRTLEVCNAQLVLRAGDEDRGAVIGIDQVETALANVAEIADDAAQVCAGDQHQQAGQNKVMRHDIAPSPAP